MTQYYYTIEDLSLARWVLSTRNTLDHSNALTWATNVVNWWSALWKTTRLYCKYIRHWGQSVRFMWTTIKKHCTSTADVYRLLKDMRKRHQKMKKEERIAKVEISHHASYRYRKDSDIIEFKTIKSKLHSKDALHARRRKQTDWMQVNWAK